MLKTFKTIVSFEGEDWQNARIIGDSPMHILCPISINICLQNHFKLFIHVLGEDWQNARIVGDSPMHILRPISINICLQKCMFDNDPRMAK